MRDPVLLGELSCVDVAARTEVMPLALLSIGAVEQHGAVRWFAGDEQSES